MCGERCDFSGKFARMATDKKNMIIHLQIHCHILHLFKIKL